jgi:hypothetical protein
MSSRPPSRTRRAARAIAIGLLVVLAATGCVGRLGRNDDDVKPDSDHPSANQSIRLAPGHVDLQRVADRAP